MIRPYGHIGIKGSGRTLCGKTMKHEGVPALLYCRHCVREVVENYRAERKYVVTWTYAPKGDE